MVQYIGKQKRGKGYIISGVNKFPPDQNGTILSYKKPPLDPFIIPPVAAKMTLKDSTHLKNLWNKAHKELKKSSVWIIWGYSFPQTDTITSVLLKTCIKESRGKKKRIIIINPDANNVANRVKILLDKIKIEKYESAVDFLMKNDQVELKNISN